MLFRSLFFELTHIRRFDVQFHITNTSGHEISDASVIVGGEKYEPGTYYIPGLRTGQHTYSVTREGFFSVTDTMTIVNNDMTITVVLQVDNTSVQDQQLTADFSIYPVPASDHVNVSFGQAIMPQELSLLNAQGIVIDRIRPGKDTNETQSFRFDTQSLSPGIYYIRLDFGYTVRVEKIIVL